MQYLRMGQKFGNKLIDEAVKNIQAELDKNVAAYICRHFKKVAPIKAKIFSLQSNNHVFKPTVNISEDEYGKIIDARNTARKLKSVMIKQKAVENAMGTYKSYEAALAAYVKKAERRSDWQYRQFILGAAKQSNSQFSYEPIRFKSQAYKEYKEKAQGDMQS